MMEGSRQRAPWSEEERGRFQECAAEIFPRMGMNADSPGGHDTPHGRVSVRGDVTEGYDADRKLSTLFPVERPRWPDAAKTEVVEGAIAFPELCEQPVLPIHGGAWVGCLGAQKPIGISKLTRLRGADNPNPLLSGEFRLRVGRRVAAFTAA